MEKETKLLIGAILFGAIAFFIPLYFGKAWLALFNVLLIGILFLGRLVSRSKEIFESNTAYRIVYGLVILIVLFNAISFAHDYGRRDFQKNILLEIRKTIDTGITKADVHEKLIYVLGQYHQNDRESVVETFRDQMSDNLGDDGIFLADFDLRKAGKIDSGWGVKKDDSDQINHFYTIDEEKDEVIVRVVAEVSLGEDPEYQNFDGQTGKFEMMFTLNEEGVRYEVLN
ncbi:hypothetical protein [Gracilimonas sp. BCB1]|uniref:hypothetical protein n=1 Tax=Gracilimonas sp. BCB1 TaxID=3152362 RepID=UPI0032D8E17E